MITSRTSQQLITVPRQIWRIAWVIVIGAFMAQLDAASG
jgi:hypothetical protein